MSVSLLDPIICGARGISPWYFHISCFSFYSGHFFKDAYIANSLGRQIMPSSTAERRFFFLAKIVKIMSPFKTMVGPVFWQTHGWVLQCEYEFAGSAAFT